LPDATRNVGHNIVHYALDHEGYLHRRIELRQLLDLAMIRAKHESAIDWTRLYRYFCAARLDHVLAINLKLAQELFDQPVPRIVRLGEYWAPIVRVARLYVAARRRDPWGAFNLLRPRTWPDRIRRLRAVLGSDISQR
jgi:hypothetical protein